MIEVCDCSASQSLKQHTREVGEFWIGWICVTSIPKSWNYKIMKLQQPVYVKSCLLEDKSLLSVCLKLNDLKSNWICGVVIRRKLKRRSEKRLASSSKSKRPIGWRCRKAKVSLSISEILFAFIINLPHAVQSWSPDSCCHAVIQPVSLPSFNIQVL